MNKTTIEVNKNVRNAIEKLKRKFGADSYSDVIKFLIKFHKVYK